MRGAGCIVLRSMNPTIGNIMNRLVVFIALFIAGPAVAQESEHIVVPFDTIKSRHMIVEVLINGKGPYTLIFDTGAPVTLIGAKLAREAKVPMTGGLAALLGNYGQQKVDTFELGGVKLDKIDAMVMDHPVVDALAKATGKKIDGIVGCNVFGRYVTTIDYQTKKLTFAPSDHRPADMMEAVTKALMASAKDAGRAPVIAPKGMLGVRVAKKAGDEDAGVDVESVFAGSAAAKAGLKAGDRILTIDSRWTDQINDCFEAARTLQPGETVAIEILRDGKKLSLKATVAAGF